MSPMLRPIRLKLAGGPLGDDPVFVRCRITHPQSEIEIMTPQYTDDSPWPYWQDTGYMAEDCECKLSKLVELSKQLMAACFNVPAEDFDCEVTLYIQ